MKMMILAALLSVTTTVWAAPVAQQMVLDTTRSDGKTLGSEFCVEAIPLSDLAEKDSAAVFDSVLAGLYPLLQEKQLIQDSEGSLSGTDDYSGDYIVRAFLVNAGSQQAYPFGIWESVQITYYKKSGAVAVYSQQLNYLESAELAEGRCDNVSYTLKK